MVALQLEITLVVLIISLLAWTVGGKTVNKKSRCLINDVGELVTDVLRKYPHAQQDSMMLDGKHVAKDVATGFHVGLQQFRAASWAKLPALWYITKKMGHKYDYIWYIDSDATVSPFFFHRSIDDAIATWQANPQANILLGNRDISKTKLIFFSNFPWRDDMPCAGSFIFRPRQHTEAVFREWWDYDLPTKNFKHFHEQDALWHMIEHERREINTPEMQQFREKWQLHFLNRSTPSALSSVSSTSPTKSRHLMSSTSTSTAKPSKGSQAFRFRINNDTFSVVTEQQFPSSWTRYEEHLWLTHIASYNYAARMPILYQFLQKIHLSDANAYKQAIEHVQHRHRLLIQPLEVAELMEEMSQRDNAKAIQQLRDTHSQTETLRHSSHAATMQRPRVTLWPAHDETNQQQWYDTHVSSKHTPTLPLSVLFEGRLIRKKNEFWIVYQGVKYGFPSFDVFLQCQFFVDDVAFSLYQNEIAQIPDATPRLLPVSTCENVKRFIQKQRAKQRIDASLHPSVINAQIDWSEFETDADIDDLCKGITRLYRPISLKPPPSSVTTISSTSVTPSSPATNRGDCEFDRDLQQLVHRKGTRSKMFIVAHNEEARAAAQQFVDCHINSNNKNRKLQELRPSPSLRAVNEGRRTEEGLKTKTQQSLNLKTNEFENNQNHNFIGQSRSNDDQSSNTRALTVSASWMEVLFIPSTVFFESMIYNASFIPSYIHAASNSSSSIISSSTSVPKPSLFSSYLPNAEEDSQEDVSSSLEASPYNVDYVITATYKTVSKHLHYNGFSQSMDLIYGHLKIAQYYNYDVVPFLRSGSEFLSFVTYWHGKEYVQAWNALLLALNYSEAQIRAFDKAKAMFYRNIFIMKTSVFLKLSEFMQKAMFVAENNAEVKKLLSANAKYKEGQEEVARRIFRTPYYQMHPFIFERLPSFFVFTEKYSLCMGDTGPCRYNS